MSLVRLNSLSMSYGSQAVFNNINAQIDPCDHIGLVGPNGTGKTTLLRIVMGELEASAGHVARYPELKIGYLPQNQEYPPGQTAFDEVYAGLGDLRAIQAEMLDAERRIREADAQDEQLSEIAMHYAELTDRFEMLGGSASEGRIASLLDGIGVPNQLWHSEMEQLSGGERNLIGLARILIGDHDLMLLDEPGNHLDFSGLEWLENFLRNHDKAFIIVSHNRYTLDRVSTRIWELERGRLEQYTGNYSFYRAEKLTRQLKQEATYRRAKKEIDRLQFNIQRLKAWSSVYDNPKLAKTAKIFEKRVEDLKTVEKPASDKRKLRFRFLTQPPRGHIAIEAKKYRKQFDDGVVLLEDVDFLVAQGERVGFIGDNGTGKSTLLKDIVHTGNWENKRLRVGKSVDFAYYSQLGENIEMKATVVQEAMRLTGLLRGDAADLLHRFLFTVDDLEKYVQVLSGGELARLQLATLVSSGADMLLLDEPTNHLDIASREAVEDALEEFPGTIVVISHDRYFLDKLADRVLYFDPPSIDEYEGNFSEFWEKHKKQEIEAQTASSRSPLRRLARDAAGQPAEEKPKPRKIKFDPKRFNELEQEIKRLETLRPEVEDELNKLKSKGKESRAATRRERLKKIDRQLEELYEEWVVLGEKKKKWK